MKAFMKTTSRFFGRSFLVIAILAWALVSCSAPLIAQNAFLRGKFSDSIELYLGAWGGCVQVSNQLNCPTPQFGYGISLDNFPGKTSTGDTPVSSSLTYGLVLLPLTGFLGLISLILHCVTRRRWLQIIAIGISILAFISALAVFPLTLYIFITASQRINNQFADTKPAELGPAIWVVLGAFIAQILSLIFLCWGLPPRRSSRTVKEYEQELTGTPKPAPSIAGTSTKSTKGLVMDDYYTNDKYQQEQNHYNQHHNAPYRPASYTYNDRDMGLVVEQPQYAGEYEPGALYEPDTSGHQPDNYIRHDDRYTQRESPSFGQSSFVAESLSRQGSRARSQRSRRQKGTSNSARQEGW